MICVSLSQGKPQHIRAVMKRVEMVELRLDLLTPGVKDMVKLLRNKHCKVIATCRPGGPYDGAERMAVLGTAIESGADYVDLEIENHKEFNKPLVELARKHSCKVIISHHDLKKTPETRTLWIYVNNCFQAGADLAKIACMVKKPSDNLRLLRLLEGDKPVVVVGMGAEGVITRVSATTLGAPFTYACWREGEETAPGQLTYKEMITIFRKMGVE